MGEKLVRGIRGAITIEANTPEDILKGTEELLGRIVEVNEINTEDIASVFLTTTPDINAEFPATAARKMGWTMVPLLCAREIDVPGRTPRLIRVLMHVNTSKTQDQIKHQYIGDAALLRPDLMSE
ncbi:chorismate mutase [Phosphitispora sp. TUW77]|uniref:chorismate mutase n=1 Tax=Phosphitispora sp. TUW77 TaxID=3152361 RepID=UPI003AB74CF6